MRAFLLRAAILLVLATTLAAVAGGRPAAAGPQTAAADTLILTPAADTHIISSHPAANYGNAHYLEQWYDELRGLPFGSFILLRFDVQEALGPEAVIDSATLELYQIEATGLDPVTLLLHPILESWDENSVTWDNQPDVEIGPFVLAATLRGTADGWRQIDVTNLAQGWHRGSGYGLELRGPLREYSRIFESVEHNEREPRLVLRYHLPTPTPSPSPTPRPTLTPSPSPTPRPTEPGPLPSLPPDLIVTDLWPEEGQVCAQIMNIGAGRTPAAVLVRLRRGGALWGNLRAPAGLEQQARWQGCVDRDYVCAPPADELSALADAEEAVSEVNEDNNGRAETWPCDEQPPAFVEGPLLSEVGQDTAVITWRTDEAAAGHIAVGSRAGQYDREITEPVARLAQSVRLSGLAPATAYHALVTVSDAAGHQTTSAPLRFSTAATADTQKPQVTLRDPGPGRGTVTLRAEATDNSGVARLLFLLDERPLATDYSPPYELPLDTRALANGAHQLTARAYDLRGNAGQDTRPFTVANPRDEDGPQVTISAPAAGATVKGTVTVKAALRDDVALAEAVLFVDGQAVAQQPLSGTAAQLSLAWDTGRGPGGKTRLAVVGRDAEGREGTAVVDVVVDNSPPPRPFFTVTNHQATRIGNRLAIVLAVQNSGSAPAQFMHVQEVLTGWLPQSFQSSTAAGRVTFLAPWSTLEIDAAGSIAPGEKRIFAFTAVPALLYPPDTGVSLGAQLNLTYYDGAGTRFTQKAPAPVVKATSGEWLAIEHKLALKAADYLLVTNPDRLYTNFKSGAFDVIDSMGRLAAQRSGAVGLLRSYDPFVLDTLLAPPLSQGYIYPVSDNWAARLHPNFSRPGGGYVLLVGETEILPSWYAGDSHWPYTDQPYASTGGSGAPELALGRVIGDTVARLTAPLEASLAVAQDQAGHAFAFADAFLVSGPPAGSFVDDNERMAAILRPRLAAVSLLHADDYMVADAFVPRNAKGQVVEVDEGFAVLAANLKGGPLDEIVLIGDGRAYVYDRRTGAENDFSVIGFKHTDKDRVAAGDVLGDGREELLLRTAEFPSTLLVYHQNGLQGTYNMPFFTDPGLRLAVGDVWGDGRDEILLADPATNKIYSYDLGSEQATPLFAQGVEWRDRFLLADVLGDGRDELVYLDWSESTLYVRAANGIMLAKRELGTKQWYGKTIGACDYFGLGTEIAAADLYNSGKAEIIIAPALNYNRVFIFSWDDTNKLLVEMDGIGHTFGWMQSLGGGQVYQEPGETTWAREEMIVSMRDHGIRVLDAENYQKRLTGDRDDGLRDADIVIWSGHGNVDQWQGILYAHHNYGFPIDFGAHHPVVLGLSCLTGNYAASSHEEQNIAERMLGDGAAVYIGATEESWGYTNREAGAWLMQQWRKGQPIGDAFTALERFVWDNDPYGDTAMNWEWQKWTLQYNLYGDPKFGAPLSDTVTAVQPAALAAPPPRVEVAVPAYTVQHDAFGPGLDEVQLPGGEMWLEPGELRLPYLTHVVPLPAGVTVTGVELARQEGLREEAGISLAATQAGAPSCTCEPAAPPTAVDGWWPAQRFDWQVVEEGDGTRALRLRLFPLRHNPGTAVLQAWSRFAFDISYARTSAAISSVHAADPAPAKGTPLLLHVALEGTDSTAVYTLEVRVRGAGPAQGRSYPVQALHGLDGAAALTLPLDLGGLPAGGYTAEVSLFDAAGLRQGLATLPFNSGRPAMTITELSAGPWPARPEAPALLTLRARNDGDVPLTGTLALTVRGAQGELVSIFSDPFAGLAPGQTAVLQTELAAGSLGPGAYWLVGTADFGGQSAQRSLPLTAAAQERLYLPLVERP